MAIVLEADDLNDADRDVLDVLREGRANPSYIADRIDTDRSYINQRLKRLQEHDHVDKLATGLYELADDPRGGDADTEADLRAELQDALEARDDAQARADRIHEDMKICKDKLQETRERSDSVDLTQLRTALDDVEAAAERGDGQALQDALRRAREAIGDE